MVDVNRHYRSPLRGAQAAQTRTAVLESARDLFLAQGYAATTVDQVAQRAGVSKPTVFTAVGSKQQLLVTVRDIAMAGDDDEVAVGDRPSVQLARDAGSGAETLAHVAAHIAALHRRYAGIEVVLRAAAATGDPGLAELWRTSERQRRRGADILLATIADKADLRPGLDRTTAADVLSLFMVPDQYTWLVGSLGWSHEQYAEWLTATLTATLVV